jgi:hypothetical protein
MVLDEGERRRLCRCGASVTIELVGASGWELAMAETDKLDAPSRHLLSRMREDPAEAAPEVSVLLRGRESFAEPQLAALRADGAEIRTVAGDVLTATVPATALPNLARHDFVVAVQLSSALHPEGPEQPGPAAAPYSDVE